MPSAAATRTNVTAGTRAEQGPRWRAYKDDVMDLETGGPIRTALDNANVTSVGELIRMTQENLDRLEIPDPDNVGQMMQLPSKYRDEIRAHQAYYKYCSIKNNFDEPLPEDLTYGKFLVYFDTCYRSSDELPDMAKLRADYIVRTGQRNQVPTTPVTTQRTPAEEFNRSIKRSKDDYTKLRDTKHWPDWQRKFVVTARAHGLDNVINESYVPLGNDATTLFEAQNNWLFSVLQDLLLTSDGMDIVRSCESQTYPAQKVYASMCHLMERSTAALNESQALIEELTTMRIHKHHGSLKDFIILFKETFERYAKIVPGTAQLPKEVLKNFLKSAINGHEKFSHISTLENMRIQQGGAAFTYDEYYDNVYARAREIDSENMMVNKRRSTASKTVANFHEFEEDYHNYEVYKGFRGPSLNRAAWDSLSNEDQQLWDGMSSQGKSSVFEYIKQRMSKEQSQQRPQGKSVSFTQPTKNTRDVRVHDLSANTHDTAEHQEGMGDLVYDVSEHEPSDAERLINMAKSGKLDDDPFKVSQFMSEPAKPGSPTKSPQENDKVKANATYIVSNNRTVSRQKRKALIDRGANGGIAGSDCRVITTTERLVDISGIDDHEVKGIPIGSVGSVILTQRGPAIGIWHQYAIMPNAATIHSVQQIESFGSEVYDRPLKLKGKQCIKTLEGYYLPIDFKNGLAYTPMRPYTDEEWEELPHIVMTSDETWDPTVHDHDLSSDNSWFDNISDFLEGTSDSPFNERGEYRHLTVAGHVTHVDRPMTYEQAYSELSNLNAQDHLTENEIALVYSDPSIFDEPLLPDDTEDLSDDEFVPSLRQKIHVARAERTISQDRYKDIKPCFLYRPKDIVEKTLSATTQYAKSIISGPGMKQTLKSPYPAHNVVRRKETVATDTVYASVPAVASGGIKSAQLFIGRESLVADIYGMKTDKQFVNTLLDTIRQRGAMDKLSSDSARVEISSRVKDVLRALMIQDWQSEPNYQHQNFAELGYRDIKRLVNTILDLHGANDNEWLLVSEYVCHIWNHMAHQVIGDRVPLELLTGVTPDTSHIYQYRYREKVYYQRYENTLEYPADSREDVGYFVGFSENVGHAMTFKILTLADPPQILHRSRLRRVGGEPNLRVDPNPSETESKPEPRKVLRSKQDEDENRPMASLLLDQDLIGKSYARYHGEDGEATRAEILEIIKENDESRLSDPEHIRMRIKMGDDVFEDLVAYNEVLEFIEDDYHVDDDLYEVVKILDHFAPQVPMKTGRNRDPVIPKTADNKERQKFIHHGSSYNVLVQWANRERSWIPLSNIAATCKSECAKYAAEKGLLGETGWKQFAKLARRQKMMVRLAKQTTKRELRTAPIYQFGIRVPRTHDEAMRFDREAGNTLWADSETLEIGQLQEYETFKSRGKYEGKIPPGFKRIPYRIVYAVKHDGRRKSRLVAGGHVTATPTESVYSGVVSLRSVRIIAFVAELNGLLLWGTDIGNAYLESYTAEMVVIVAGPEFGELAGHLLQVMRALYGLKSSGLRWAEKLTMVLRSMGFFQCYADPCIWMRKKVDHYEYIGTYVDDLEIASRNPQAIIDDLTIRHKFKLKGTGDMTYHLGVSFQRDPSGTLCQSAHRYIMRMIDEYKRMYGESPKEYSSPLEKNDHPETDESPELSAEGIRQYQSMIGMVQWAVSLGRFDVATAVMTMSSFRANPRVGHLLRVKRIIGYLSKMRHGAIRYRTSKPDMSAFHGKEVDWTHSVYGNVKEVIPENLPEPLGKSVVTTTFVDANLYHNLLTGRSVTGTMEFINKTPIDAFSKKQNTVETSTYGSEFVAARTATERTMDLRMTLRYMGIPLERSYMLGDNESVVTSSTRPESPLTKRHTALSYHRVREAIAAGIFTFHHIPGVENPADMVSKHWGYTQMWQVLRPVLFTVGNTDGVFDTPSEPSIPGTD